MGKTVWINGTERLIENKDRYGMYHTFLDDKDIKWLNSLKPSDNSSSKKDCYNKKCKKGYCFDNQCHWRFMDNCEERKHSPS